MDKDLVLANHFLERALELIESTVDSKSIKSVKIDNVEGVLADTLKLCEQEQTPLNEPVRTLHHLSCSGGTLITKCVASMANVLILNEIDFASPLVNRTGNPTFTPTDIVSLLRQGDEKADSALIRDLFLNDISVLLDQQTKVGRVLTLRDHSHSHFLVAGKNIDEPTLYETTKSRFDVLSLVSVRDPVDSYASMVKRRWHLHFEPSTFDEYCRRYLLFLDRHEGLPVVKYEDFVAGPQETMQEICSRLALDYFPEFLDVFDSFVFSGDSGRRGTVVAPRERREVSPELQNEIDQSKNYVRLCNRLGYELRDKPGGAED